MVLKVDDMITSYWGGGGGRVRVRVRVRVREGMVKYDTRPWLVKCWISLSTG